MDTAALWRTDRKGAAGRFTEEYSLLTLAGVFIKAYFDAALGLHGMIRKRLK